MTNWLADLSKNKPTAEELLRDSVDELRGTELGWDLECSLDPSLRTTNIEKMAAKLGTAIRHGRELAHENSDLEKIAFIPALAAGAGRAIGALGGAKGLLGGVAKDMAIGSVANKAIGALKPAAPAASAAGEVAGGFKYAFANGLLQSAAGYVTKHPGTALTAAGALGGAMMAPRDQQTGQKQYLRGAVMGGVGIAGVNAVSNGALANKMRASVMNRNSPLLGQGTRTYLMDAAAATKGKSPMPAAVGSRTGQPTYGKPTSPTPTSSTSSSKTPSPEWAGVYRGVDQARAQTGFNGARAEAPFSPPTASYRNGPTTGAIKLANRQTLTYDPATKTFYRQHLTSESPNMGNPALQAMGAKPMQAGQGEVVRNSATGMHHFGTPEYVNARINSTVPRTPPPTTQANLAVGSAPGIVPPKPSTGAATLNLKGVPKPGLAKPGLGAATVNLGKAIARR